MPEGDGDRVDGQPLEDFLPQRLQRGGQPQPPSLAAFVLSDRQVAHLANAPAGLVPEDGEAVRVPRPSGLPVSRGEPIPLEDVPGTAGLEPLHLSRELLPPALESKLKDRRNTCDVLAEQVSNAVLLHVHWDEAEGRGLLGLRLGGLGHACGGGLLRRHCVRRRGQRLCRRRLRGAIALYGGICNCLCTRIRRRRGFHAVGLYERRRQWWPQFGRVKARSLIRLGRGGGLPWSVQRDARTGVRRGHKTRRMQRVLRDHRGHGRRPALSRGR
mmetsp:Transcript_15491/g.42619  ORF Transcript_15491/g.42619 Transcript_15491/m.42619 type:complete len:271 (+) Transcript_15491:1455-2267(+)